MRNETFLFFHLATIKNLLLNQCAKSRVSLSSLREIKKSKNLRNLLLLLKIMTMREKMYPIQQTACNIQVFMIYDNIYEYTGIYFV